MAFQDPHGHDDEEGGVLAHVKHNLSKRGDSLRYLIEEGSFTWRGVSKMTADELSGAGAGAPHERTSVEEAVTFLREHLSHGERPAKEVLARGRGLGLNPSTLGRARLHLGVLTRRAGFGKGAQYHWSLPVEEGSAPEDADEAPI